MRKPPPASGRMKKGEPSRNKKGSSLRKRVNKAAKDLGKTLNVTLSAEHIAEVLTTIYFGSHADVDRLATDETQFGRSYAAKLAQHGFQNADLTIFKALTEMVIGKPKERTSMELTGKDGKALEVHTRDELLATAMALRKQVDSLGDD